MYFKSRHVCCFVSFFFCCYRRFCSLSQYGMPRLFFLFVLFCKHLLSNTVLPLDCAPFTSFSFILSKSRCPVLTAGLRIYLTKEYCMFNKKKIQKRFFLKKQQKLKMLEKKRKEEN